MISNEKSFEHLDRWCADQMKSGPMGSWIQAWHWARLTIQTAALPKNPSGRGSPWEHWKAYRRLALRRFSSMENARRLNQIDDPFQLPNEVAMMGYGEIWPAKRACDEILFSSCPLDYAPRPGLPSARDLLIEWGAWFDQNYLVLADPSTRLPDRRASALARQTIAKLEETELRQASDKAANHGKPSARRL